MVLTGALIPQHSSPWFWRILGQDDPKSPQPVSVGQYLVLTPQHIPAGSAAALQLPWDVGPLVPPCGQGSNESYLHELCCRCACDVATAPLIPAGTMGGRTPARAQRGLSPGVRPESQPCVYVRRKYRIVQDRIVQLCKAQAPWPVSVMEVGKSWPVASGASMGCVEELQALTPDPLG